jgi:hypothetical protein
MNLRWVGILFLGIGLGLGACGDDDGDDGGDGGGGSGGSGGSSGNLEKLYCLLEDSAGEVTGCDEHSVPAAALEASEDACTSDGGMVVDSCPSANRVGRCSLVMGALIIHYYEPDDPVDAEEMCTALGGTWTDG